MSLYVTDELDRGFYVYDTDDSSLEFVNRSDFEDFVLRTNIKIETDLKSVVFNLLGNNALVYGSSERIIVWANFGNEKFFVELEGNRLDFNFYIEDDILIIEVLKGFKIYKISVNFYFKSVSVPSITGVKSSSKYCNLTLSQVYRYISLM